MRGCGIICGTTLQLFGENGVNYEITGYGASNPRHEARNLSSEARPCISCADIRLSPEIIPQAAPTTFYPVHSSLIITTFHTIQDGAGP
jgi:hypothetical protein